MSWYLDTAAAMATAGLVTGFGVPALVARIPEPVDEEAATDEADVATPEELGRPVGSDGAPEPVVEQRKEPYAAIAALPGLGWKAAFAGAVVGALVGARTGWEWELLLLAYLVPVGIALAVVDWRTRLLPTWVIAPSYAVVVGLALLASLLSGDWSDLVRAGWGWAVAGGTFLLLWLVYPRGMGYGDVRLSGVLGIVLGYLGWGPLLVGVYAGFLLGGVGGGLLTLLRLVDRRSYPFGPFMLLGALVGVLWGTRLWELYLGG